MIEKQNLKLRILSSLFLIALIVGAVLSGRMSFQILLSIMSCIMFMEWSSAVTYPSLVSILFFSVLQYASFSCAPLIAASFFFGAVILTLFHNVFYRKEKGILVVQFEIFYTFASLWGLNQLYMQCGDWFVLWMFVTIWLTDSGAFFFGHLFGKKKLAPHISPGKTWAGVVYGTLFATVVISGGWLLISDSVSSCIQLSILTLIVSCCSHIGDLIESYAKRMLNVKDIGKLIPGHGGFSDRFDSLLFVSLILLFLRSLVSFL